MALWPARSTGVLFGGVYDEDRGEEGMESVFYNDLYVTALTVHRSSQFMVHLVMGIRCQGVGGGLA